MGEPEFSSERREAERSERRLGCELVVGERSHTAVVIDMSDTGLFVRTHAEPPPGDEVRLVLRRPGGEVWELRARVARVRRADGDSPLISGRGLGLEILEAPEAFQSFLEALQGQG